MTTIGPLTAAQKRVALLLDELQLDLWRIRGQFAETLGNAAMGETGPILEAIRDLCHTTTKTIDAVTKLEEDLDAAHRDWVEELKRRDAEEDWEMIYGRTH